MHLRVGMNRSAHLLIWQRRIGFRCPSLLHVVQGRILTDVGMRRLILGRQHLVGRVLRDVRERFIDRLCKAFQDKRLGVGVIVIEGLGKQIEG